MRLRFHSLALAEYVEAIVYLEQRREGYGAKFEDEVDATLGRVLEFPQSGAVIPGYPHDLELRRFPLRVFQYSLIVGYESDEVIVYAVAHQQRRPGYWNDRVLQ